MFFVFVLYYNVILVFIFFIFLLFSIFNVFRYIDTYLEELLPAKNSDKNNKSKNEGEDGIEPLVAAAAAAAATPQSNHHPKSKDKDKNNNNKENLMKGD